MAAKDPAQVARAARNREIALKAGRRLARCPPGEEVMITGIAGVFPDSDNVHHFGENLIAKRDLISDDDRRWKLGKLSSAVLLLSAGNPTYNQYLLHESFVTLQEHYRRLRMKVLYQA